MFEGVRGQTDLKKEKEKRTTGFFLSKRESKHKDKLDKRSNKKKKKNIHNKLLRSATLAYIWYDLQRQIQRLWGRFQKKKKKTTNHATKKTRGQSSRMKRDPATPSTFLLAVDLLFISTKS